MSCLIVILLEFDSETSPGVSCAGGSTLIGGFKLAVLVGGGGTRRLGLE